MTTKEQIKQILVDYTKKNGISASVVILEDYADELIKHGVVEVVRCKDCEYFKRSVSALFPQVSAYICDNAYGLIGNVTESDYCSYGIRRNENGN